MERKVDASYRVSIPKEYLKELNINKLIKVEAYVDKIILRKSENDTEVILENKNHIKNKKEKISAIEDSEEIKLNVEPIAERCHKCLRKLKNSRFKLNGKFICRSCRNDLRNELIEFIKESE